MFRTNRLWKKYGECYALMSITCLFMIIICLGINFRCNEVGNIDWSQVPRMWSDFVPITLLMSSLFLKIFECRKVFEFSCETVLFTVPWVFLLPSFPLELLLLGEKIWKVFTKFSAVLAFSSSRWSEKTKKWWIENILHNFFIF